jgi:hypothetical protein
MYLYLRERDFRWRGIDRSFLALILAPAGLAGFCWRLWRLTGNPLAFIGIQRAWNNSPAYPFAFLVRYLREPVLIGSSGWDPELLSVAVTCAIAVLFVWSGRKRLMPMEYLIFFGLQLVVLTCRSSTLGNLRYATGCFPFFLVQGILAKRPLPYSLLLAFSAACFGLFAALFAAGQQHHPAYHFVAF